MKYTVFVDGQEGTTGLKINERLNARTDIELLVIPAEKRKEPEERSKMINQAEIVFLCLPDSAAKESVSMVKNTKTRIIDASTAYRTDPGWSYGLPELSSKHRESIANSRNVSVPGCYATGFNLIVYPLVNEGIIPAHYPVVCHAISGYSGGGKKLIEKYQNCDVNEAGLNSPQLYALGLGHKHIPEMHKISGLLYAPLFSPIVSNFYKGMTVCIPLHKRMLSKKITASEVADFMSSYYKGQDFVKVMPFDMEACLDNGFLGAMGCNDTNRAEIYIFGNDEQIMLVTRLDNLGKGSSGAAVQNMNIMLGLNEGLGL